MVVHHAHGLHESITDRRSDKLESPAAQGLTHCPGFSGLCWDIRIGLPVASRCRSGSELPDESIESGAVGANLQEGMGIDDRRFDFTSVTDYAGIGQKSLDVIFPEAGDFLRRETGERSSEIIPFPEDCEPTQPGLHPVQDKRFKEAVIIMYGHSPFFIMIAKIYRVFCYPSTPGFFVDDFHSFNSLTQLESDDKLEAGTVASILIKNLSVSRGDDQVHLFVRGVSL